ncbi:DNA-binding protein snt1 [Coemansia erecta]|uniref:DNA-binding protein snt1 n=1 Tax=Coemansia erecta TaxID=147472 RepID=A0A9W8CQD5_9FUNG|nr:DNA-binding protein snt1 [Coemansia erecta]
MSLNRPTTSAPTTSADAADRGASLEEGELSSAPQQVLQSRISDIEREIAAYQQQLVQISATGADAQKDGLDDRAVPGSPPPAPSLQLPLPGAQPATQDGQEADEASAMETGVAGALAGQVLLLQNAAGPAPEACVPGADAPADPRSPSPSSESDPGDPSDPSDPSDSAKDRAQKLVATIYAENQRRAGAVQAHVAQPFLSAYPCFIPGAYAEPADWPFWAPNERTHEKLRPHLARILVREQQHDRAHARRLQEEYRELYGRWRRRVDRLDRQREARQRAERPGGAGGGGTGGGGGPAGGPAGGQTGGGRRRGAAQAAAAQAADEFGFSLGPLFSAAAAGGVAGALADGDVFTSDAVHSDAELAKIIERLQHDDARNPDLRSQRTAAVIPPMELGAKQRAMLQVDNGSHLIADPLTYYHARVPAEAQRSVYANNGDADHFWTQAEVGAFVAAYLAHPKQFGKVAAALPYKSMNACVLFYYRNKKPLRLKELEARSSKRARRAATGSGGGGGGVGGSRRRKERTKERRERRAREARERLAEQAAKHVSPAETPGVAETPVLEGDEALDALGRRSKSSALLRSIIAANRRRKLGGDDAAAAEAVSAVETVETVETVEEEPEEPAEAPAEQQQQQQQQKAKQQRQQQPAGGASSEEEGELVDDDERWAAKPQQPPPPPQQRRRSRPKSELNAYAMGGSIVRTRRARELEPPASSSSSRPAPPGSPPSSSSSSDAEVVEASGRVADLASHEQQQRQQQAQQQAQRPRVVSRKSQSRFGATLTAIIDHSGETPGDGASSDTDAPLSMRQQSSATSVAAAPTESALDRFVASEPSALRRPISSYETLLMCPGSAEDAEGLDALVDAECGERDSVLVGAAAWARDDRRRVLRGFHRLGADFARVAALTPSKTPAQCRYFFHHYRTPQGRLLCDVIGGSGYVVVARPQGAPGLPLRVDSLVLPPTPAVPAAPAAAAAAVSSDDEDDETPLAAQLAEELAQQQQQQQQKALPKQQHAQQQNPPLAQVRPELLLPRAPSLASLVLPPQRPAGAPAEHPPQATPSPASSLAPPASSHMTAKKSGYSSYWSVHERSAFLHYVVRLGQDWLALAEAIGSKTGTQVRNYFRANREKLGLDAILAEHARNKASGTLPPMVPFMPAPMSASTDSAVGSPGTAGAAGAAGAAGGIMLAAAVSGEERRERRGRKRKTEGVQPSTAPASVASFPTMGVDGGRAVVVSRPPPPVLQPQAPWINAGRRRDSVALPGESDTPSQPTPPPVDGLRLSSASLSPRRPAAGTGGISSSSSNVLHISNLTHAGTLQENVGRRAEEVKVKEEEEEEPQKASVRRINALLNDDMPMTPQAPVDSAEWFGEPQADEEAATGIAALALASMMGGEAPRGPPPGPPPQLPSGGQYSRAFSPVLPPMQPMQQHQQHQQSMPMQPMQMHPQHTRPSSVGPSLAYMGAAAGVSPGPRQPPGVSPMLPPGRQRKPSAPLPAGAGAGRYGGAAYGASPEASSPPSASTAAESGLLLPHPVMPPTAGRRVTSSSVVFPPHHRSAVLLPPPMQIPRDAGMHQMPPHQPPPMQYSAGHRPLPPHHHSYYAGSPGQQQQQQQMQMQRSPQPQQQQPPHGYPPYHPHEHPHQHPQHSSHQHPHQHPPQNPHQHPHQHHGQYQQ